MAAVEQDNVGVVGYGLYVGGLRVSSASDPSTTVTNLTCGRSYLIAVDAVDAAGNRSAQASSYFSTAACADTQVPTRPSGLLTTATTTSLALSWSPATDNVAVTGYGVSAARIVSTPRPRPPPRSAG